MCAVTPFQLPHTPISISREPDARVVILTSVDPTNTYQFGTPLACTVSLATGNDTVIAIMSRPQQVDSIVYSLLSPLRVHLLLGNPKSHGTALVAVPLRD